MFIFNFRRPFKQLSKDFISFLGSILTYFINLRRVVAFSCVNPDPFRFHSGQVCIPVTLKELFLRLLACPVSQRRASQQMIWYFHIWSKCHLWILQSLNIALILLLTFFNYIFLVLHTKGNIFFSCFYFTFNFGIRFCYCGCEITLFFKRCRIIFQICFDFFLVCFFVSL